VSAHRRLSDRQLTLSLLSRQLLLRRQALSVPRAVERLAALQAQYSPSPYLALYARVRDFQIPMLERALARRLVVKSTLMRGTLHLVSAGDYPHLAAAWRRQWLTDLRGRHRDAGLDEDDLAARLIEYGRQPRTTDEIREKVNEFSGGRVRDGDLLHYARALVPFAHVPPSGHWRQHGQPSLVAWPEPLVDEPAATARLVVRYLAAFGPATREDLAQFSYLRYRQLDPALATLEPLRRFRDERDRVLLDLPRLPIPDERTPVPVRLLPKWDAALLSHADRTRILPAAYHGTVVRTINGEVLATYLIDGMVAGVWSTQRKAGHATLTLRPFRSAQNGTPGGAGGAELEKEAAAVLAFCEPDARSAEVTFGDPIDA
jgi:hypothetical protein